MCPFQRAARPSLTPPCRPRAQDALETAIFPSTPRSRLAVTATLDALMSAVPGVATEHYVTDCWLEATPFPYEMSKPLQHPGACAGEGISERRAHHTCVGSCCCATAHAR